MKIATYFSMSVIHGRMGGHLTVTQSLSDAVGGLDLDVAGRSPLAVG